MDFFSQNILFYFLSYIVGSIPFGLLLAKYFANIDIRESGSKSIGATNVLRVLKQTNPSLAKKLSIATLGLDAGKSFFLLFIAKIFGVSISAMWMMAILLVLGHCYSIFLKLNGGKGVATGIGSTLFLLPIESAIALFVWAILAKTIKISSVSSILAIFSLVISSYFITPGLGVNSHAPLYLLIFIILYKHIPNIIRLFKGEEKRV